MTISITLSQEDQSSIVLLWLMSNNFTCQGNRFGQERVVTVTIKKGYLVVKCSTVAPISDHIN